MVSTSLLLCALILDAGKEDEKEMELMEWVLELLVEYAKKDLSCSREARSGSKRGEAHFFFFFFRVFYICNRAHL